MAYKQRRFQRQSRHYFCLASLKVFALAGKLGIAFVFARFINSDNDVLAQAYNLSQSSSNGTFAISILCTSAPSKEEAKKLIGDQKLQKCI